MEKIFEEITQKRKEIVQLQNELQKQSKDLFNSYFQKVFESNEKLESVSWTQYTPYFNDGETCVFSAHTDYLIVNGQDDDEADWLGEKNIISWGTYNRVKKTYEGRIEQDNPLYDKDLSELVSKIKDFLNMFDNDFYLRMFGDHSKVTITKGGSNSEEYQHD
jgi:hypothetical protein